MSKTKEVSKFKAYSKTPHFWIIFISIFFIVGIVGISLPQFRHLMVPLSAVHLLLTYLVLYYSRQRKKDKFLLFSFFIFCLGILVESIGTNTGLLFGNYSYGATLGWKIYGVPLIIGVNWATMVICSSTVMNGFEKMTLPIKVLFASLLMTTLDFLIEPVAIELDFWRWKGGEIPIYNYICWFVISLPMNYFYVKWKLVENNSVPKAVLVWLAIFFLTLNIL